MTFFSRPNLDDIQFRQDSGSTLTLSGQTKIRNVSGLTLNDGNNNDIVVTASGASSSAIGHVLGYDGEKIRLMPSSASGDTVYNCASPTTTTVGGLSSGSNISGCDLSYILEKILVPAQPPTTSMSIVGGSTNRQFGDTSTGSLCWNVTVETNDIECIELNTNGGGTYNCTILTGGSLSTDTGDTAQYSYDCLCAAPPQGTESTSIQYGIRAISTENETATSNVTIRWRNKKYYFADSTLYTDDSIESTVQSVSGQLSTSKSLNITQNFDNEFFYYVYPMSFGSPSFKVNGLTNSAWGNSSNNTLYSFSYTNSNGYSDDYYVARSDNRISGEYTIVVS
ncbi:MAG: hypothetical protein ACOC22_02740 [bacterium]